MRLVDSRRQMELVKNPNLTFTAEVTTGCPRTNNAVECWKSNFVKVFNAKHPSFPKLNKKFKDEQKNAETQIEKLYAGKRVSRYEKPQCVQFEKKTFPS